MSYTLSHPENDRDVTERAQGYMLQVASFMRQSRCSFLNVWENTLVASAMTSVFLRKMRCHGRFRGETKYRTRSKAWPSSKSWAFEFYAAFLFQLCRFSFLMSPLERSVEKVQYLLDFQIVLILWLVTYMQHFPGIWSKTWIFNKDRNIHLNDKFPPQNCTDFPKKSTIFPQQDSQNPQFSMHVFC